MIWGYGDRGYGPYRVAIMLSQSHTRQVLERAFELCDEGHPKDAYNFFMENRIRLLGPSFGTKLLMFATPREVGAPIYDSFVGKWIARYAAEDFAGLSMNPGIWNSDTYAAYWSWIKKHANHFLCMSDEVELVLFRDAEKAFSRRSPWATR
jgi:hypothetical protein